MYCDYCMGKNLGQHFLQNKQVIDKIIEAGEIEVGDAVLEIGPGEGVLTKALLKEGGQVVAIEKDPTLVKKLEKDFQKEIKEMKLKVIHADIRDFEVEKHKALSESYKIIANIPYYLTSNIIRRFLSKKTHPDLVVLLVQKEVAERIVGGSDKESVLSLSVKAYGNPQLVEVVGRENFHPQPKVDSAVLKIDDIDHKFFNKIEESQFFELIKQGFSHKRKQLANNISLSRNQAEELLSSCQLDTRVRAEKLTLSDWQCLYRGLFN